LAFHSNNGPILWHFSDKGRNWSKIVIFSYILHLMHTLVDPRQNIAITFGIEQEVKVIWQKAPHFY